MDGNFPVIMSEENATPSQTDGTPQIDWPLELQRNGRWLRSVIHARCGEPQAVEEIFQEVATAAIAQKSPLQDASKVGSWLYQLAVRQSLLYRRKLGRKRKLEQNYAERGQPLLERREPVDPLGWLLASERRKLIRQAMENLPDKDAELLLLKYTENWSYHQIAEHVGISHSAVESRLHRARAKLRTELAALNVIESQS